MNIIGKILIRRIEMILKTHLKTVVDLAFLHLAYSSAVTAVKAQQLPHYILKEFHLANYVVQTYYTND